MRSTEALKQLLRQYAIPVNSEAGLQAVGYLTLLEKWNVRINLTSSTEWRIIGPMFREGFWAAKLYPPGSISHLDIGSGAGFPALLLKILHPRIELELIESRGKKGQFLETAAHTLGLTGVHVRHERLGDYLRHCRKRGGWDCVSWKAIKLSPEDLWQLRAQAREETQFWMFHGLAPAVAETHALAKNFDLVGTEKVPGRRDWSLSIYRPRFT